jgi:hypothetical protein
MDLNYVFLRQQVERSRSNASASEAARKAHRELARAYEREIERRTGGRIVFSNSHAKDAGTEPLISARPSPSTSS